MDDITTMAVDVHLGYHKQGDDLNQCLEHEADVAVAFMCHRDRMLAVADHLEQISIVLNKHATLKDQVKVDAGTHCISITGPSPVIQELIDHGVATVNEEMQQFLDEEAEGEDEDGEGDEDSDGGEEAEER
jgi:hypothetical protein